MIAQSPYRSLGRGLQTSKCDRPGPGSALTNDGRAPPTRDPHQGGGARTRDLPDLNRVRYQLRYARDDDSDERDTAHHDAGVVPLVAGRVLVTLPFRVDPGDEILHPVRSVWIAGSTDRLVHR